MDNESTETFGPDPSGSSTRTPHPHSIGPYRILEVLGEGGMGIVYLAEQQTPIQRRVALKLIKLGMDTTEVIARFEAERQALALMNHPNIARVFDAGTAEGGRPYFVMEYVPGIPLIEYCDRHRLTISERLAIFLQVCSAVQHAHQKGIIHRDIKPSNVLVAVEDGKAVPKVIDFGIAKATNQRLTEKTLFTQHGVIIGTPAYMSPEQAEVTNLDVGTTSDVYSLGVLLYEMLVGAVPFDPRLLREAGFDEMRRIIREEEPPKLTLRLKSLGGTTVEIVKQRRTDLASLKRQIRGDLEWITIRALEKDPTRRYATASEFAADIHRHLADEPVLAGPPTLAYRLGKFARKNRRMVAAAGLVLLALLLGLVSSTVLYLNARAARDQAEWRSYVANLSAADASLQVENMREAKRRLEMCEPALRGWEWSYLMFLADQSIDRFGPVSGPVRALDFTPDGQKIVALANNELHVWDTATRKLLAVHRPVADPKLEPKESLLSFSPGGEFVVSETQAPSTGFFAETIENMFNKSQILRVRESATGRLVASFAEHRNFVAAAAFSPDGKHVVSAPLESPIRADHARVWETASGKLFRDLLEIRPGHAIRPTNFRNFLSFTNDGGRIVHGSPSAVRVWDVVSGRPIHTLTDGASITAAAVSPDGNRIASASDDKTVRIWDAITGKSVRVLRGLEGSVQSLAFASDRIAAAFGKTIRTWNMDSEDGVPLEGHEDPVTALAFSANGRLLASGSGDRMVRLWNPDGQQPFRQARVSSTGDMAFAFSPDGNQIAIASADNVSLWNLSLKMLRKMPGHEWPSAVAFSPDGSRVATAGGQPASRLSERSDSPAEDRTVLLWDVASGRGLAVLSGHQDRVTSVRFTPDGGQIVSASEDETVRVWDALTGALIQTLTGHSASVRTLAVSADGNTIATGSDKTIRLWDRYSGKLIRTIEDEGAVTSVSFGVDGRLVSGSDAVRVWDVRSGALLAVLRGHDSGISSVGWSPDQRRIVSGSGDSTVRLWDATRYEPVLTLGAGSQVSDVSFSPSGKEIVAATEGGKLLIWRIPAP